MKSLRFRKALSASAAVVAVLLSRFNRALAGLSLHAIAFDDETGAVKIRKLREGNLAALFGEHEVA